MKVIVNGDQKEVPNLITIEDLIEKLNLSADRLAVERNREVVSRSSWPKIRLEDGDHVEIIHFVGGGM